MRILSSARFADTKKEVNMAGVVPNVVAI